MSRLLPLVFFFAHAASAAEIIVHASPEGRINSLAAARDEVRRIRQAQPGDAVRVRFAAGTYAITEPVVLTEADSGKATAPVTYEAAGKAKVIISGGRRITGWAKGDGDLWRADVPKVRDGSWYFEQLWINGRRATRARSPNTGFFSMYSQAGGDAFPNLKEPNFRAFVVRPPQMELLNAIPASELSDVLVTVTHAWTVGQCRIEALSAAARAVEIRGRSRYPFVEFEPDQRYFIENYRAALDEDGEWFLSRDGVLLYKPMPGEDMSTAEVVAPVAEKFLDFKADWAAGRHVSHITFRGITFAHAQQLYGPDGHHDGQAASGVGAVLELEGAREVAFEDCEIAHTGGYGIWFRKGSSDCAVRHTYLHDLGAGGVRIGEIVMPKSEAEFTQRVTVDDSIIHSGGRMFPSACGVFLAHAADCSVTHCDIGDLYYTGISAGWVWGYSPSPSKRNRFDYNHIHHLGHGYLSDMGGFYGLGRAEGTTVSHNYVHHVASYRYGGWGLYTDEGSTGVTLENNLVHDTSESTFHQHYGKWNRVSNNIFAFGKKAQIQRSRPEKHASFAYEQNIVIYDTPTLLDGTWYNWEPGTLEMRNNVYWNSAGLPVRFHDTDLAGWQKKTGRDEGSIVADPLFVDAAKRDFRLKTESPAFKLGFKPFDFAEAGVRGDAKSEWRKLAMSLSFPKWDEESRPWPMPEFSLNEDFEHMGLSFPTVPRQEIHWQNKGDSIFVSDEQAASGKRSLKFTDVPGLKPQWDPHYVLKPKYSSGMAAVSFNLRLGEKASLFVEWRGEGQKYVTGPSLWIESGRIVERRTQTKLDVPANAWIHIEATSALGSKADGKWTLRITLPGQPMREFKELPCDEGWNEFAWLGFVSASKESSVFYVDDLKVEQR
ncbi:MAG: right-handed parallel beta-helix repeat-containing protein [Verrucomicrobiaceae bacterium]|nr:right-handed parallel beta-helix repeat-containing protein [Verrucomicrobiaceae bacterium]